MREALCGCARGVGKKPSPAFSTRRRLRLPERIILRPGRLHCHRACVWHTIATMVVGVCMRKSCPLVPCRCGCLAGVGVRVFGAGVIVRIVVNVVGNHARGNRPNIMVRTVAGRRAAAPGAAEHRAGREAGQPTEQQNPPRNGPPVRGWRVSYRRNRRANTLSESPPPQT